MSIPAPPQLLFLPGASGNTESWRPPAELFPYAVLYVTPIGDHDFANVHRSDLAPTVDAHLQRGA